jgi:hypothetical protein
MSEMLTGFQAEVIAFIGEGEFICYECAHEMLDEGEFAAAERGFSSCSLTPVCRYSMDAESGEVTYEYAREMVGDFLADHPAIDPDKKVGWGTVEDRLVEWWAESHPYHETCGNCGKEIE